MADRDLPSTQTIPSVLAKHRHPGELLACLGEAWLTCSCGERIDLPVRDDKVNLVEAAELFEAHQTAALAPWLAEHDASVRERALWDAAAALEAATPEPQPELPIVTGERSGFIHAHHIVSNMRCSPASSEVRDA